MADYKEKFDDLHRAAKQKARELDEKLGVSGIVEDASRVAGDAARKGARTLAGGAEQLRKEAESFTGDPKLRENARQAAGEAKRHAKEAGKIIRDAATDAGKAIRDAAGPARKKAEKGGDDAPTQGGSAANMAGEGAREPRGQA